MPVVIRLRKPNSLERSWLSLDPRGNKHDDLMVLGFSKHGQNPDDVLCHLLQCGIPNATQLHSDRLETLEWTIRTTHVDWTSVTDAKTSTKGLSPALATHVGTDETITAILAQHGVVPADNRWYLHGAPRDDSAVHGQHYVNTLDELRVLLRQTGSLIAADAKPRRSTVTAAEKLVLQLWAATAPYALPNFEAGESTSSDTVTSNIWSRLERLPEPEEESEAEESDEEEQEPAAEPQESNAATMVSMDTRPRIPLRDWDVSSSEEEESDQDSVTPKYRRVSLDAARPPSKKPRLTSRPKQQQPTFRSNPTWMRHKEQVLRVLYNDTQLSDAGKAIYQVLELQQEGCREYDAILHSIVRGLELGQTVEQATQRTMELLGDQCARSFQVTAAMLALPSTSV